MLDPLRVGGLCAALLLFAAAVEPLPAADLPVTAVTLYKHGIGLFQRQGTVAAGETVQLHFDSADMNDLLKSLLVTDSSGAAVTAIRYDANESLAQRLSKFPFQIGDRQSLSVFLDTLKGSKVQIGVGEQLTVGRIVGAREQPSGTGPSVEQLTLFLESGVLANYALDRLTSIRLLDAHQQEEFKTYLETLGTAATHNSRNVFIESNAKGPRSLQASYIAPAAIWKSSYRLSLDKSPSLEGWAIVDNTTGEDWNNVRLAVVSGRPISFISPLDTAHYGNRQVAELPQDRAAGPVVYGGSVDAVAIAENSRLEVSDRLGQGPGSGSVGGVDGAMGGDLYRAGAGLASAESRLAAKKTLPPPPSPAMPQAASTVEVTATGATLGELFEYSFAAPITIKKNQSAMLPFLQDRIGARKLLIYTGQDSEHPVNAAELTNTSGKTLDGGPITVYDGGAYAGEALIETLKNADKRLIGYAVDYGTRVTTAYESGDQHAREIHVQDGLLKIRDAATNTVTYTIRNVDSKPKTLIVEQNAADKTILSPKPWERSATAYRFEVELPANGDKVLRVLSETTVWNTVAISGASSEDLLVYVQNGDLPAKTRNQLLPIQKLKAEIAQIEAAGAAQKEQVKQLTDDQIRVRANINSLNHIAGQDSQVGIYSTQLATMENQIVALRTQSTALTGRRELLNQQLAKAIEELSF